MSTDSYYPTPTRCGLDGGSNSRKAAKKRGMYVTGVYGGGMTFPTPTAHGLSGGSGACESVNKLYEGGFITEQERCSMRSGNGGKLNPDWVEWLMGWGIGWSDVNAENDDIVYLPIHSDPADNGEMDRLTDVRENRVSRIKCLGNGQVPLCAAVAFEYGMFELNNLEQ